MNILQVHNRYKITGGEWTVLTQEYNLLNREHVVEQLIVDNNEQLNNLYNKLKLIFTTHYNSSSKKRVKKALLKNQADIMHVHNFFPLLSPSVFDASLEAGIPSVLTLHNYRLIHPNGYLLHNGAIDERSITGTAYSCVPDGVYRDSILQTAVVAHMIEYHRKKNTWHDKVDCFICLTEFAKSKFEEAGLPEEKMKIKPNFVDDPLKGTDTNIETILNEKDAYYLFIGRISEEKGVRTLVSAWEKMQNKILIIIGDGPIKKELQSQYGAKNNITWLGYTERHNVMKYLKKAKALIFPSEWFEGMPMTILEAFSTGTPVITSNIGSQAEIVTDQTNGLHFKVGDRDSLMGTIEKFEKSKNLAKDLGREARREFDLKYSPEVNYSKLISIYNSV